MKCAVLSYKNTEFKYKHLVFQFKMMNKYLRYNFVLLFISFRHVTL